ncbi:trigger factor [bacterium]|nr:trigger factor [bacterium]
METVIESPMSWKRIIKVTYSPEEIKQKMEEKYKKYSSQLRLPGFRPGKAPIGLIKARFGELIKEELMEDLSNEAYKKSLEENELTPVSKGSAKPSSMEENQEFIVTIEVEVLPKVELNKYTGFSLTAKKYEVTDNDVQDYIDETRTKYANYIPVERGIQDKDYVVIGYQLEEDEDPAEEPVMIDKVRDPGLFERLKDAKIGDVKEVKAHYPPNYKNKEKAGTEALIKAKVLEIKEPELPELNMEFLKSANLKFDSVDAYRANVRKRLEEYNERQEFAALESAVVDELIKANPLEIPPTLELEATNQMISQHVDIKKLPEDELKKLQEKFKPAGNRMVQKQLLLGKVIEMEKISASKDEVKEEVQKIAEENNTDMNKLYMQYRNRGILNNIKDDIKYRKAIQHIVDNSKVKTEKIK